jgi:hypothetical protein
MNLVTKLAATLAVLSHFAIHSQSFSLTRTTTTTTGKYLGPTTTGRAHQRPRRTNVALGMVLDDAMRKRLDGIARSYQALTERLGDPDVIADSNLLMKVMSDRSKSEDVVNAYNEVGNKLLLEQQSTYILNISRILFLFHLSYQSILTVYLHCSKCT